MNIMHMQKPDKPVLMEEAEILSALNLMKSDSSLNTTLIYRNEIDSSEHSITFIEKHMIYLKGHPKVNPQHYLANLRTMIKIRQ